MKKKILTFETDAEAEEFVANADLADYDLWGRNLSASNSSARTNPSISGFRRNF